MHFFRMTNPITEIIMAPEIKFGIVVLTNQVENAQEIAIALSNTIVPVFDQLLRSLQPSFLPTNWKDYVGVYSNARCWKFHC